MRHDCRPRRVRRLPWHMDPGVGVQRQHPDPQRRARRKPADVPGPPREELVGDQCVSHMGPPGVPAPVQPQHGTLREIVRYVDAVLGGHRVVVLVRGRARTSQHTGRGLGRRARGPHQGERSPGRLIPVASDAVAGEATAVTPPAFIFSSSSSHSAAGQRV